jgi:hypothetical protein
VKNGANQTILDFFSNSAPFRSSVWNTRAVPDGSYTVTAQVTEKRAKAGVAPRVDTRSETVAVNNGSPSFGPAGEVIRPATDPCAISETLNGVAAIASDDIWAVGTRFITGPGPRMLIKHWDGVRWTGVISPNVGTHENTLHAVAASGASDAWAVGEYRDDSNFERTLTLRWDGARWKVIASPNVSPKRRGPAGLLRDRAQPGGRVRRT